ncbi:MAG: hypothetical protein IT563_12615 [Alphaproteobacteria bacterium]|nr:hypothetical protein [Alphaproteobacteria bacterium]
MRGTLRSWFVLALLALAACGSIPQGELASFTTAVRQARQAGEAIVADYQAAGAEKLRRDEARVRTAAGPAPPTTPFPLDYAPPDLAGRPTSPTTVRLLAWEAIAEYSTVLARLNAGESVDDVKSSTQRLADLAGKIASAAGVVVPGADVLVSVGKELAARLEQARLAAEFKKAIHGGAPTVRRMLGVFRDDTKPHYVLRSTLALADYDRLDLDKALSDRDRETKRQRIKAEIDQLRASLDTFVRLLDQTDASLAALERAVDKPVDLSMQAGRILDLSLELKQYWQAYQDARTEGRS